MIARARAYHAGFNAGFNIAEAVNFALPSWIEVGKNVSYCKCERDSVRIEMDEFLKNLKKTAPGVVVPEEAKQESTISTLKEVPVLVMDAKPPKQRERK